MRKVRVFESISVDGYFADAGGGMEWAYATPPDPAFDAWVAGNAGSGGELLFGRVTYEMMAAFWPTPLAARQMPEVAAGMNAAVKWVATRTVTPSWTNARRLEGDLVPAVRNLKASSGPDVTVLGSGRVAAALGAAGLVDEYQLVVVPVALGAGRTLFTQRASLRLIDQRAFANGKVVVTYAAA